MTIASYSHTEYLMLSFSSGDTSLMVAVENYDRSLSRLLYHTIRNTYEFELRYVDSYVRYTAPPTPTSQPIFLTSVLQSDLLVSNKCQHVCVQHNSMYLSS